MSCRGARVFDKLQYNPLSTISAGAVRRQPRAIHARCQDAQSHAAVEAGVAASPNETPTQPVRASITDEDLMSSLLGESWEPVLPPRQGCMPSKLTGRAGTAGDGDQSESVTSAADDLDAAVPAQRTQPSVPASQGVATAAPAGNVAEAEAPAGGGSTAELPVADTAVSSAKRRSDAWIKYKRKVVTSKTKTKRPKRQPNHTLLPVVAACVHDKERGRVLIAQRPKGKRLAGCWEFPGGKIEPAEAPEDAMVREMCEELNITLDQRSLRRATFFTKAMGLRHLVMLLYVCTRFTGEVVAREQQNFAWASFDELRSGKYKFAPGDRFFCDWVLSNLDPLRNSTEVRAAGAQASALDEHADTAL